MCTHSCLCSYKATYTGWHSNLTQGKFFIIRGQFTVGVKQRSLATTGFGTSGQSLSPGQGWAQAHGHVCIVYLLTPADNLWTLCQWRGQGLLKLSETTWPGLPYLSGCGICMPAPLRIPLGMEGGESKATLDCSWAWSCTPITSLWGW